MRMIGWMALAALTAAAAAVYGQGTAIHVGSHPDTATVAAGGWEAAVRQLGSEDFKEREAGQKQLAQANWRDVGALKSAAAKSVDAEVRARLEQRVAELEQQLAMDPPPVTVEVKDADLVAVSDALARATGLGWSGGGTPPGWRYTLKAVDEPFWDVVMALNRQHPIEMLGGSDIHVQGGKDGAVVNGQVQGPFLIYPIEFSRRRRFQEKGAEVPELAFRFGVLGDPRLKVADVGVPQVLSVIDDRGVKIFENTSPRPGSGRGGPGMIQIESTGTFPVVPGMGKTVTVRGAVKASLVVKEQVVEVADLMHHRNEAIPLNAKRAVRFSHFLARQDEEAEVDVVVENTETGAGRQDEKIPISIKLVDAAGKTVWQTQLTWGSEGATVSLRGAKLPLNAVLGIAEEIKAVTVPFEFKDVPVP